MGAKRTTTRPKQPRVYQRLVNQKIKTPIAPPRAPEVQWVTKEAVPSTMKTTSAEYHTGRVQKQQDSTEKEKKTLAGRHR